MDDDRFESLTRTIGTRRAVSGAIAGAVAGLLRRTEARAARCPKRKKRCGKQCIPKRGCCTTAQCKPRNTGKVCRRFRCVCPAGTKRCGKRCLLRAAACPPKPDASCLPGGVLDTGNFYPSVRIAQTFTEPNGGRLTAADFWFCNYEVSTVGTYELRLTTVDANTGVPQVTTLGLALRSSTTVGTDFSFVRFTFPAPPLLRPSKQYALVLTMIDAMVPEEGWNTQWRVSDPCPGGSLFLAGISGSFAPLEGSALYKTFVTS